MDRSSAVLVGLVLAPSLVLAAFVAKARFDAVVASEQSALARERVDQDEIARMRKDLDATRAEVQARDDRLSALATGDHDLQAELDEQTAINAKLRAELERLGRNVDQMLQEKGTLARALDDAKARLDELRKAQAAAEARAQLFQQFVQKFRAMIDAGQLKVATRNGRLVLQLPNDVLFDSGQTLIRAAGRDAIVQVARVLQTVHGRTFQVAGHTDNVPIQNPRFPSNWELSTARAVEVVNLLVAQGVEPQSLSAAGYGEFDPIASNEAPDGRARNRRIEITFQPNLDELVSAPVVR